MKNALRLHEAIAVVLLSCDNRTATFEEIAEEIEKKEVIPRKKRRTKSGRTNKVTEFDYLKQIPTLV
jgi:molybdopterin synthase catalytic subunit